MDVFCLLRKFFEHSVVLLSAFLFTGNLFSQSIQTERAGDALQIFLPGVAGISTLIWHDEKLTDAREFGSALSCSVGTTLILKYVVDKERPNGGKYSFPSGHTSTAFCGAAFILRKYGWIPGVPALGMASYVAWSRIYNNKHDLADIVGGVIIGAGSSFIFSSPSVHSGINIGLSQLNDGITIKLKYTF
jgi:membrane-associated phospholipid phosphatase